jgi:hypothetical protein
MWHNWDQQEKPWRKLLKITDETDRDLFFCSTTVAIGDGKLTPFWIPDGSMGFHQKS